MLRISREQRETAGEPAFVERLMAHLLRYYLESMDDLPDEVLRGRVRHGLARGRAYGLTWEYSLTVFVAHMLRINPEFDRQPAIQRELSDPYCAPDLRIDRLAARVTAAEWEEAARRGDPGAYWRRVDAAAERSEEP